MQSNPQCSFCPQPSKQSHLCPIKQNSTFPPLFQYFTELTQKTPNPPSITNPLPRIPSKIQQSSSYHPIINKLIYIIYHMLRTLSRLFPRFSTEVQKSSAKPSSSGLTYYKDGQLVNRTSLTLKKQEDIESYVIKTIQNYFRTTYKQGVNKGSALSEHGLDSLDAIEISMQIEEDLGYTISAETLPSFTKVKHYISYIQQVEAFKRENNKSPIA